MSRDMKKLLACGCSYTKYLSYGKDQSIQTLTKENNQPDIPTFWPEYLANDLGLDYINAGESGAGNDFIFNRAVQQITERDDIEILCIVWTQMFRMNLWNYTQNIDTVNVFAHGLSVFSKEDPIIYEVAEMFLEKLNSHFWLNKYIYNYFTNISVLIKLCNRLGIKIIMAQAMMFEPDAGGIWTDGVDSNYFFERYADIISDINFDPIHIIGWPIVKQFGGTALQDYDTELHKPENRVADKDWHPNEKGHRIIANEFLKKYKEIYS